jgi:hypothetical protein
MMMVVSPRPFGLPVMVIPKRSGIRAMSTVGRNLDRSEQILIYLSLLLWFFLNLFSSIAALL